MTQQHFYFFCTFLITLLSQLLKPLTASDKIKNPLKKIFSSSFDIIFTSIGFIYALVEKDNDFQFLYLGIIVLLLVGLALEKFLEGEILWISNLLLMAFTIASLSFFVFIDSSEKKALSEKDLHHLGQLSNKTVNLKNNLKKICSEYLSEIKPFDEVEFKNIITNLTENDLNEDEINLFMACFFLQKGELSNIEEDYLKKIKSNRFDTDKSFIKFKINRSNYDKISNLELDENLSWLEINKEKIKEAKKYIDESYKRVLKILILDASAGRGGKKTDRGNALKTQLREKEYSASEVAAFDYNNTEPNVKLHSSGFYAKSYEKKGLRGLKSELIKLKYTEFKKPGNYISREANSYDLVIITSK